MDRLPCGATDQVVERAHNDSGSGTFVHGGLEVRSVGACRSRGVGPLSVRQDGHEGFGFICVREHLADLAGRGVSGCGHGCQDSACHGYQCWGERDARGGLRDVFAKHVCEVLFNFGNVAVGAAYRIRACVAQDLAGQKVWFESLSCPGDSVCKNCGEGRVVDVSGFDQWLYGQRDRGDVTAGDCDTAGLGKEFTLSGPLGAEKLRETVRPRPLVFGLVVRLRLQLARGGGPQQGPG